MRKFWTVGQLLWVWGPPVIGKLNNRSHWNLKGKFPPSPNPHQPIRWQTRCFEERPRPPLTWNGPYKSENHPCLCCSFSLRPVASAPDVWDDFFDLIERVSWVVCFNTCIHVTMHGHGHESCHVMSCHVCMCMYLAIEASVEGLRLPLDVADV